MKLSRLIFLALCVALLSRNVVADETQHAHDDEDSHDGHAHDDEDSHDGHAHDDEDSHAGHDHGGGGSHDGHDHGGPFEWAGIFETPGDVYTWTAQKTKEKDGPGTRYISGSMKLAVLPAGGTSGRRLEGYAARLHGLEEDGKRAISRQYCVMVEAGGSIAPEKDVCYKLVFRQSTWQSLFLIDTTDHNVTAFFAQHTPTEYEANDHYLKDHVGEDVEPMAELPEKEEEDDPWGAVVLSSAIVNIVTLAGVVFFVPGIGKMASTYPKQFQGILAGFAAGAILSCAFFLLLFEATHLIAVRWAKEVDTMWRWGTMILAGFLLPGLVDSVVSWLTEAKPTEANETKETNEASVEQGEQGEQEAKQWLTTTVARSIRARVVAGVLIGDFFHNLCDGFFIGAAFKGCGNSFGWTVALSTVLHELPQELADYAILTGPGVDLKPALALLSNFLSGISVVLGGIIILATNVEDGWIGLLLAFGGGTYLHISATECMPKIYDADLSSRIRVACIFAFMVGAVLIGLVLLDHEHCVSGDGDAHAGHNH